VVFCVFGFKPESSISCGNYDRFTKQQSAQIDSVYVEKTEISPYPISSYPKSYVSTIWLARFFTKQIRFLAIVLNNKLCCRPFSKCVFLLC
jgi:hypothetical protein